MKTIDLTPVLEAAISLCAALITIVLIPMLKQKLSKGRLDEIKTWVGAAVAAAEQIYKGSGRGDEKKAYVLQFLKDKGYTVDLDAVDKLIESAVYALKGGGTDGN